MRAGEQKVAADGHEVRLFPLEYMYISQGPHNQTAIDYLGWGPNGRVRDCPVYAPFSGRVTYNGNDHNMIIQSLDKVHLANGNLDYCTMLMAHRNTPPPIVGTVFTQGDLIYNTGNYGLSSGDHLHLSTAPGHVSWNSSGLDITGNTPGYNIMFVDDTVMVNDYDYPWLEYGYTPTPPTPDEEEHKFPWFIYARKLRGN